MTKCLLLAVPFIVGGALAVAGDPPRAPAAKNPNMASPDDSPKQALRKLVMAIDAGDRVAVRSFMFVDPSNDPAFADNWAAILTANGRLKNAVREKLGAEAFRQWEKQNEEEEKRFPLNASLKEIEAAEVHVHAEGPDEVGPLDLTSARLRYPGNFVRVSKVDRVWTIDIEDWTGLPRGDKRKRLSEDTLGSIDQGVGDTLNHIAEQVETGKIKTLADLNHAERRLWGTERDSPPPPPPKE